MFGGQFPEVGASSLRWTMKLGFDVIVSKSNVRERIHDLLLQEKRVLVDS